MQTARFTTPGHQRKWMAMAARLLAAVAIFPAMNLQAAPPEPVLPATFAGVMPCADCAGIAQTLTLRADGLYRLRSTYLGKPGGPFNEVGRWERQAGDDRLMLRGATGTLWFARQGTQALRLLDRQGQPIESNANLQLRRTAQVDAIGEVLRWRGEFVYRADAASFTDCASGLRWPVAMRQDYLALERHYAQARSAPGAPLLVEFDGRLALLPAMEGPAREQMLVESYRSAQPAASCNQATQATALAPVTRPGQTDQAAQASLIGTYWKLLELDGAPVAAAPVREAQMTLAAGGVTGFSGCNRFFGGFASDGDALRFTQIGGTRMACAAPSMALESAFLAVLGQASAYRIDGERLTLLHDNRVLARFASVYLH